ncbi:uncharacterized protein LOC124929348 isoform X2 [Impatiens glandulifera]|uniref:uncharacterized protein LOC124929348 isoform X2 n=1 Tax=Impatiens glandulifera TaxID=253017 RepID=UPI001FB0E570|nr:uncharacterized protein LOC124929348 isoform X2 [Impatiens glandulifera]
MSSGGSFLCVNGILASSTDIPSPVSVLLQTHQGAYTTTRTHDNGSVLLFWQRHLRRLAESAQILCNSNPKLLFGSNVSSVPILWTSDIWESIELSIDDSVKKVLPIALKEKSDSQELSVTVLVSGYLDQDKVSRAFNVFVHAGFYVPPMFGISHNAAHLAVVGRGRSFPNAKYSDWVRIRKSLEEFRPSSATEILLSNDGDRILEGSVTNFFVVCRKVATHTLEVQTAPLTEGVLPGVIRQVIIDICFSIGIAVREVAPSWSERETWEEAFITSSLRLLQHVETVQVPRSLELLHMGKPWKDIITEKRFTDNPGRITTIIQEEIIKKASTEGWPVV